jgi:MFS family permease
MGSRPANAGLQMAIVVAATFLGFLGIGAILPVLAPHVRRDLGQSDVVVGFAIGIFSIVALAGRLLSGPITDRRGRKYSYTIGLALCSSAGVAYLLPFGIWAVFAGRILQGLGEAFLFTGAAAWIVELGGSDRQARSLGWLSSGIWGGICVGPVIGQLLGAYHSAAWMLAITPLPAIAALRWVPEHYTPPPARQRTSWIPRGAIMPGLVLGFVNVHYPAIAGFLVLHLAGRGNIGGTGIALYAGMILTSRFFLGGLPDKLSPMITFYAGISMMLVGLLVTAAAPPAPLALVAAGLVGFGFSFPWPSIAATVLRRADPAERASTLGAVSAFVDAFVGASALITGRVAQSYGYPAVYLFASAGVAISAALAHGYLREPSLEAETPLTGTTLSNEEG